MRVRVLGGYSGLGQHRGEYPPQRMLHPIYEVGQSYLGELPRQARQIEEIDDQPTVIEGGIGPRGGMFDDINWGQVIVSSVVGSVVATTMSYLFKKMIDD